MKKIFTILFVAVFALTLAGCEKVGTGEYKEGTYFGFVNSESYGTNYTTTAVIYVGSDGAIKSVFLDTSYNSEDVEYTTKKSLGDDYGMKSTSANMGNIENGAEWYEQVKVIEDKTVEEQGTTWAKLNSDNKLDGVSGCTITANVYIEAINKALEQAK